MAQRIVFKAKQVVELEEFEPAPVEGGMVRVRTNYSLMSTGTENIAFNQLFEPGSHWANYVQYPFYPGYSLVGTITAVGAAVDRLKIGDRVAVRAAHASEWVGPAQKCFPIPTPLDLKNASWFALAKIAFMGVRAAEYRPGDSVLIVGVGPIGQMSVRWANALGLQTIIAADGLAERLDLAGLGGATHLIAQPVEGVLEEIKTITNGNGPRVVIDATGSAKVFASVLRIVGNRGRVVILGDTGTPGNQHLTGDVITRGLSIVGAHDGLNDDDWNDATINAYFFKLVESGRFNLDKLNTHTFVGPDCKAAYALANTRQAETMGILFDWQ